MGGSNVPPVLYTAWINPRFIAVVYIGVGR